MPFYHYRLTFRIKTPFLSKKVGAQHFGYDMSMLKDANGFPIFLGSQIRGNLRHALQHFHTMLKNHPQHAEFANVLSWFGESSDKNTPENPQKFDPIRAQLNFAYFWQLSETDKDKTANNEPRYRIGIDKQTGTVKKGNLQVIESVFKTGLSVDFSGVITAQLTEQETEIAERWLRKAAQFVPAIGALKGTGFGKVETATLTRQPPPPKPETKNTIPENAERF
jgi:CRISPR/Cas system CMR subunit Cmr4 (Cas7 group RAMP superfamily)